MQITSNYIQSYWITVYIHTYRSWEEKKKKSKKKLKINHKWWRWRHFTWHFYYCHFSIICTSKFQTKSVDDEPLVNPSREMETLRAISRALQDYNIYILENLPPKYVAHLKTFGDKMEQVVLKNVMKIFLKRFLRMNLFREMLSEGSKCIYAIMSQSSFSTGMSCSHLRDWRELNLCLHHVLTFSTSRMFAII